MSQTITIIDSKKNIVRTFSEKEHGADFANLAKQFVGKYEKSRGYIISNQETTMGNEDEVQTPAGEETVAPEATPEVAAETPAEEATPEVAPETTPEA